MARLAAKLRLALFLALVGAFGFGGIANAGAALATGSAASEVSIALGELPLEARQTLQLIQNGGPFPYPGKDGNVFGNFERRLPQQARGYYREYTVPTPGRQDRGARRVVAGQGRAGDVATSGEYYYSADHYRSFRRIRQP